MRTPCKQICQIEEGICVGCNRTLYEVAAWSRLSDDERSRIMETLHEPNRVKRGLAHNPDRSRTSRRH
jgi:predicted Fe-S protein YdhL (DUF1289 family)